MLKFIDKQTEDEIREVLKRRDQRAYAAAKEYDRQVAGRISTKVVDDLKEKLVQRQVQMASEEVNAYLLGWERRWEIKCVELPRDPEDGGDGIRQGIKDKGKGNSVVDDEDGEDRKEEGNKDRKPGSGKSRKRKGGKDHKPEGEKDRKEEGESWLSYSGRDIV